MKVSIIVRCLNEEKFIGKLLSGIEVQNYDDIEVIVVDSGSTDATLDIAQRFNTSIISILPADFSFGRALNLGCQAASGDILLFASAHVYPVYKNWISEMITPFQDEKIAVVYGKQIGNELTKYSEHRLFAKWFPDNSNNNQAHPFCNNANCAIRKRDWEQQPYDELLTGLEDLDWAQKILLKGYKIAYNAEAVIVHVHEETPKRILNRYRREAIALKNIIPSESFSIIDFLRLFIGNTISDYYHAIRDGVFLKMIWDIPMFRFMQFWGTYKGYHQRGDISNSLRSRFYYPNGFKRTKKKLKEDNFEIKYSSIEEKYKV